MGSAKRNRRKYEKPKEIWNLERIKGDGSMVEQYGLKNMRELWKAQTEISRIRRNARLLLSGEAGYENIRERMLNRLQRIGLARPGATVDDLLDLKENSLLERRLQTIVFRKGLAKTIKQARQLTVHGFISVNGKKVSRPGFLVEVDMEKAIAYYRPIDLSKAVASTAGASAAAPTIPPSAPIAPAAGEGKVE